MKKNIGMFVFVTGIVAAFVARAFGPELLYAIGHDGISVMSFAIMAWTLIGMLVFALGIEDQERNKQ